MHQVLLYCFWTISICWCVRCNTTNTDPTNIRLVQTCVIFDTHPRHLPIDCPTATKLPAATPPPFIVAAIDINELAIDPDAIPPAVKPMAPNTAGAAKTVATPAVAAPSPISTAFSAVDPLECDCTISVDEELKRISAMVDDNMICKRCQSLLNYWKKDMQKTRLVRHSLLET